MPAAIGDAIENLCQNDMACLLNFRNDDAVGVRGKKVFHETD